MPNYCRELKSVRPQGSGCRLKLLLVSVFFLFFTYILVMAWHLQSYRYFIQLGNSKSSCPVVCAKLLATARFLLFNAVTSKHEDTPVRI